MTPAREGGGRGREGGRKGEGRWKSKLSDEESEITSHFSLFTFHFSLSRQHIGALTESLSVWVTGSGESGLVFMGGSHCPPLSSPEPGLEMRSKKVQLFVSFWVFLRPKKKFQGRDLHFNVCTPEKISFFLKQIQKVFFFFFVRTSTLNFFEIIWLFLILSLQMFVLIWLCSGFRSLTQKFFFWCRHQMSLAVLLFLLSNKEKSLSLYILGRVLVR